ncbi:hypothetical protein HY750_02720 [Candidatus Kuenenbacteria bacterium]|nr:hypothetical protein [Candidatus Kuenenbacteria bacterium]
MKFFCINGYGVPKNIFQDGNYERYLGKIMEMINSSPDGVEITLVLCGDHTNINFPEKSEAGEMKKFFENYYSKEKRLKMVEIYGIDGRDNLEKFFHWLLGQTEKEELVFFCEWCRRGQMKFLTKKIFGKKWIKIKVIPVDFDQSLRRRLEPLRQFCKYPLTVFAWYFSIIRKYQLKKRQEFIDWWGKTTDQRP